ncbi:hypothetical protein CPT32_19640 [Rhizobium sophoriradicis]|uniref:hypothetical protein n=1 Tax=Rhizobium sophoriradicis TaxID=1535245 RepID=UPI000BBDFF67|nr:hypothetical protein [Rhizobium sophoriradicis]PCK85126.1 hypothetical protein CPT32_19640 [Rhizobium sophoriradicis]
MTREFKAYGMLCASGEAGILVGKSSSKTGKFGQKAATTTIAFRSSPSRTLGYEDYDGLGWTAAWRSRPQATLNQK